MKKLSLKNLKLEASDMLQRNQLKSVFGGYSGGYSGVCENGKTPVPYSWDCGDGNSGSGYVCPEHAQATLQFYLDFCLDQ